MIRLKPSFNVSKQSVICVSFSYLSAHPKYSIFSNSIIEAQKVFSVSPEMCAVGCRKALELEVKQIAKN